MIVAREKVQYHSLPEVPAVKERPRRRPARRNLVRKEKIALTGLVVLFFCTSVLIAVYYAQVLATGYLLNKTQGELAQLRKESHDLYTRVNQFSSLENVEVLAVNRLGMVKPQSDQVILVQSPAPAARTSSIADPAGGTGQMAAEKHEPNWVIRAFTKMVGRLEASIHAG